MKHKHQQWCRNLFDRLDDGGLWAVPRSGVVFRKNEAAKALILVGLIPREMIELSDDEAIAGEFLGTREMFGTAGIKVERGFPLKKYASLDEAKADQEKLAMVRLS
jgi:hypothetical protein